MAEQIDNIALREALKKMFLSVLTLCSLLRKMVLSAR